MQMISFWGTVMCSSICPWYMNSLWHVQPDTHRDTLSHTHTHPHTDSLFFHHKVGSCSDTLQWVITWGTRPLRCTYRSPPYTHSCASTVGLSDCIRHLDKIQEKKQTYLIYTSSKILLVWTCFSFRATANDACLPSLDSWSRKIQREIICIINLAINLILILISRFFKLLC